MLLMVTFAFLVALSWAFPTDLVIQFERSVVNGTVVERIFVNDAHLKGHQPVVRPIQDEVLKTMVENSHKTAGYATYIRLRECKFRGYQVLQLSDRFQLNGRDYLILDPQTDSWIMQMPELHDLKQPSMPEAESTSLEKIHLKDECEEMIKEMNDTQNQEGFDVLRVMAPVLSMFFFVGFIFISFLMFKRHGQHPGGVLGSIVHYPPFHTVPSDGQSQKNIDQVPVLKGPH